jgi:hypothetical protein
MPTPPSDSAARRCTFHCSGCDSCFLSLRAFDAHRGGSFRPNTRACWPEEADERVEVAREDGLCEIGFPVPTLGRVLWRTPTDCMSPSLAASDGEDGLTPDIAA